MFLAFSSVCVLSCVSCVWIVCNLIEKSKIRETNQKKRIPIDVGQRQKTHRLQSWRFMIECQWWHEKNGEPFGFYSAQYSHGNELLLMMMFAFEGTRSYQLNLQKYNTVLWTLSDVFFCRRIFHFHFVWVRCVNPSSPSRIEFPRNQQQTNKEYFMKL